MNIPVFPPKLQKIEFLFSQQGSWVAVYYTTAKGQEFFLVQVTVVHRAEQATVNYLQQCSVKDTLFKFPTSTDLDPSVYKMFVFNWNLEVATTNGRIWIIEKIKNIKKNFRLYLRKQMDN